MGELPKQLLAWMARLLPKQTNEGAGAVQIGRASGDVHTTTTSNVTIINLQVSQERPTHLATTEQREVLAMLRKLHQRDAVFVFRQRQFGTRMVIDLEPGQLLRVRRYVETIRSRTTRRNKDEAN